MVKGGLPSLEWAVLIYRIQLVQVGLLNATDEDRLKSLLKQERRQTQREVAIRMGNDHIMVVKHLKLQKLLRTRYKCCLHFCHGKSHWKKVSDMGPYSAWNLQISSLPYIEQSLYFENQTVNDRFRVEERKTHWTWYVCKQVGKASWWGRTAANEQST